MSHHKNNSSSCCCGLFRSEPRKASSSSSSSSYSLEATLRRVFLPRYSYIDAIVLQDFLDEVYGPKEYSLEIVNDRYELRAVRNLTEAETKELKRRAQIRYPGRVPTAQLE